MDIADFFDTFFEEAEELLADMEQHLLELDVDDPDSEQLNAIFRAAHSIKVAQEPSVLACYKKPRIFSKTCWITRARNSPCV